MGTAERQVASRRYIKPATAAMVVTVLACMLMLLFCQRLRVWFGWGDGAASSDETLAAAFTFFVACGLPAIAVLWWYMSRDNWRALSRQKTYKFQGTAAVILMGVWCVVNGVGVFYAVFLSDYPAKSADQAAAEQQDAEASLVKVGQDPLDHPTDDDSKRIERASLPAQVQYLCTAIGWLLTVVLACELFDRKATSSA